MKHVARTSMRLAGFLALLLCLSLVLSRLSNGGASAPDAVSEQLDRWVAQLGDDDFEVREEATHELEDREEAKPLLRKALTSPDPEARRRAADILATLERKQAPRELDKALELAKDGRVDEVVERLVRWQGSDVGQKGWEAVYQLAAKAAEINAPDFAKEGYPDLTHLPLRSSHCDLLAAQPTEAVSPHIPTTEKRNYLVRGDMIDARLDCRRSIFAAARSLRLGRAIVGSSIIVCGGNVEVDYIEDSIIICDGDFTAHANLTNCIVVARGKVTAAGPSGVFISAHNVEFPISPQGRCVARLGDRVPLGFIKFFDSAEAGVEVGMGDDVDKNAGTGGGVVVKAVAKDKPFAAAGLQVGDVIVAVGDEQVAHGHGTIEQLDSFRRPLRKMLAADEEFTLTVRRGDKTLDLKIKPTD